MPTEARHRLLEVAAEHDLLIFEDNSYGALAYDGEPPPTLASMDREGRVIYLSSFSKTLCPGLRVGFLVYRGQNDGELISALERVKSFTTINTSPLMQAIVGGVLRSHSYSLLALIEPARARYRQHRDQMIHSLAAHMNGVEGAVSWNRPSGGFFLALTLPFDFDDDCLRVCAEQYGVICSPMSYFASAGRWRNVVRLSFSYVTPPQIEQGIACLARFVAARLTR
jgi:(S)-3,5-dihydroxyphenylglycine transaminase